MFAKGLSDADKKILKKHGYTPESARDYAVKKLKKAKLDEKDLALFDGPVDELPETIADSIMELAVYHKDDPDAYMKITGRDLSEHSDFIAMQYGWHD